MVSNSKSTGLTKAHGPFDGVGESSGEKSTESPDPRWPYLSRWSSPKPPTSPQPLATSAATTSPPKTRPPTSAPPPLMTPPEALVSHPPSQSNDASLETEIVICDVSKSVLETVSGSGTDPTKTTPPPAVVSDSGTASKSLLSLPSVVGSVQSEIQPPPAVSIEKIVVNLPANSSIANDGSGSAENGNMGNDSPVLLLGLPEVNSTLPNSPLGAWARPINFNSSSASQLHSSIPIMDGEVAPVTEIWPSLRDTHKGQVFGKKFRVPIHKTFSAVAQTRQSPERKEDALRFPWAAKMNPASRNLYRATEPEYMDDGTPKVTIPQHVLLQGLENQKEYILGQFYRCSPPSGGLIYAVLNKLWGRSCRITIRKLGESSYLFHIPDQSTRTWVLQRGLWHVDDCLMFVASWTPEASLAIPEIKTIPIWVTLKKIPNILYSIPGISHIASGLGAPMATYKPRLDPILMGEAKILVEVELSKAFPTRIAADDENGFISMVDVEYAWLPSRCGRCDELGHKVKHCLQAVSESHTVVTEVIDMVPNVPKSTQANSSSPPSDIEVPSTILLDENNESNSVDPNTIAKVDDLTSPATISVLESMVPIGSQFVPASIPINETIESPIMESATTLSVTDTSIAHATSTVQKESRRTSEPVFGSNKFASLISLEEEDSTDSDKETDSMDLMTPLGKRILRERPVKPSTKAREMHQQSTSRGRGNRGRGNRGGHG